MELSQLLTIAHYLAHESSLNEKKKILNLPKWMQLLLFSMM